MQRKIIVSLTLFLLWLVIGAWYAAGTSAATPSAENGKAVFDARCAICHTIGGGDRPTGPDLEGVTGRQSHDWLIRIIVEPQQVIAESGPEITPLLEEYGIPMPNLGVTAAEAEDILAYLGGPGMPTATTPEPTTPAATTSTPTTPSPTMVTTNTPRATTLTPTATTPTAIATLTPTPTPIPSAGDAEAGRAIFTGETGLVNGGGSCISCHNFQGIGSLGGGTLAGDMTNVYARLGPVGLAAIMKSTPFPIMKEVYGDRPLTEEEIEYLVAFFQSAGEPQPGEAQGLTAPFAGIGIGGVIVVAFIFHVTWRKRLSGVRRRLVEGGQK